MPTSTGLGLSPWSGKGCCAVSGDEQAWDQGAPFSFLRGGQHPPLTWVPPLLRRWAEARGACPCVWSTRAPQESPGTWGGPGRPFPARWLVGGL